MTKVFFHQLPVTMIHATLTLSHFKLYGMMKKLHKRGYPEDIFFEPKDGERSLLCSNNRDIRSPSLGLTELTPEEEREVRRLAEIIFEAIVWRAEHEADSEDEQCNYLLPGIDERTGGGGQ